MGQRIKLVFVDEIARFVARRRGFCACWYLVPHGAKLVGDVAYAIMAEFELLGACPSGVELALQELPLLPNQDARIVRDNDEIHVHCASSEAVTPYSSSSSVNSALSMPLFIGGKQRDAAMLFGSSRDGEDVALSKHDRKRRERQLREMQQRAQNAAAEETKRRKESKKNKKEAKRAKSQRQKAKAAETLAMKANKESSSSSSSSSSDSEEDGDEKQRENRQKPQKSLATKRKAAEDKARSSKPDSSSSSDGASSSSSSDSESDDEKPAGPERKRLRVSQPPAPTLPTRPAVNSNSVAALAKPQAAAESEGTQRRRRRPRHRKPRDAPASAADKAVEATAVRKRTLPAAPKADSQTVSPPTAAVAPPQHHSLAASSGEDSSTTTPAPIVKGHVRFGDAGESQVVAPPEKVLNVRKPRSAYVPPELHKYGPRSEAAEAVATERSGRTQSKDKRLPRTANSNPASSKKKADEMWKRPYEIVASIHDTPVDTAPSIDIQSLLAMFPPSSTAISTESVAEGDVIAYKTLTLCMETWQPLVSAWLCGRVASVAPSEGTISVTRMALSVSDQQLQWKQSAQETEEVQASELSELRYLHGPSFQALKELQSQQQQS